MGPAMENNLENCLPQISAQAREEAMYQKSKWAPGEWHNEPDEDEFEYRGIKCLLWRNKVGAWCGYIFIPKDLIPKITMCIHDLFDVHGGITYQKEQEDGSLRVGFDCAHFGDRLPGTEYILSTITQINPVLKKHIEKLGTKFSGNHSFDETYKNIEFARGQCEDMVNQLKDCCDK